MIGELIPVSLALFHRLAAAPWQPDGTKHAFIDSGNELERVAAALNADLFWQVARLSVSRALSNKFLVCADGWVDWEEVKAPSAVMVRLHTDVVWDSDQRPLPEVPRVPTAAECAELDAVLRGITLEMVAARYRLLSGPWYLKRLSSYLPGCEHGDSYYYEREDEACLYATNLVYQCMAHSERLRRYSEGRRVVNKFKSDGRDGGERRCMLMTRAHDMEGAQLLRDFASDIGFQCVDALVTP